MQYDLSDKERDLLCDIIDWWLEDYDQATTDVIRDKTHDTPEQMLSSLDGMHDTFALATAIKGKLEERVSG